MTTHSLSYTQLPAICDTQGVLIATCRYYPQGQLLYITWSGNITSSEVIAVAESFLELQQYLPVALLLNDKTDATGDWSEALPWLEYEWLPKATKGGLKAFAYVFSPDMRNQYVSLTFIEKASHQLTIQDFHNPEEAFAWLLCQQPAQY